MPDCLGRRATATAPLGSQRAGGGVFQDCWNSSLRLFLDLTVDEYVCDKYYSAFTWELYMCKAHTLIFCMHNGINDFSELLYFQIEGVLN